MPYKIVGFRHIILGVSLFLRLACMPSEPIAVLESVPRRLSLFYRAMKIRRTFLWELVEIVKSKNH